MGRKPTIDREHVLAVADAIVAEQGAAALTIDAVAKGAGITKGGVQSCFGTKEALISALMDRWSADYESKFRPLVDGADNPPSRTAAHAKLTLGDYDDSNKRAATLLAALLQTPEHLEATRTWYRERLRGLTELENTDLLMAFLATEGAFLLRYLGLVAFSDQQWSQIQEGVQSLIDRRDLKSL